MRLQFDRTIKAGDVLTSLTVTISALALVFALAKERSSRTIDQASKVRSASASAIVKLDRWQAVELSLYQELQPLFVELSEGLAAKFDVVEIRDKFWRQTNAERTRIARQVLEEQLGTAYLDITAHLPSARARYVETFAELANVEQEVSDEFLAESERAILGLRDEKATYQTAHLGNALRDRASQSAVKLKAKSETVIAPLRAFLLSVIALPDDTIVNREPQ